MLNESIPITLWECVVLRRRSPFFGAEKLRPEETSREIPPDTATRAATRAVRPERRVGLVAEVKVAMSALNKLAHLSLVNKVTTELENHIGIGDKTLSEFVIDLADKHSEPRSFQKALDEVGAELSFDLVRNLLEMIQRMRPKAGSKSDRGQTAGGAASGSRAPHRRRPPPRALRARRRGAGQGADARDLRRQPDHREYGGRP